MLLPKPAHVTSDSRSCSPSRVHELPVASQMMRWDGLSSHVEQIQAPTEPRPEWPRPVAGEHPGQRALPATRAPRGRVAGRMADYPVRGASGPLEQQPMLGDYPVGEPPRGPRRVQTWKH